MGLRHNRENKEEANKISHLWQKGKGANRNIKKTVTASLRMELREEKWEGLPQHCLPGLSSQVMHSDLSFTAF